MQGSDKNVLMNELEWLMVLEEKLKKGKESFVFYSNKAYDKQTKTEKLIIDKYIETQIVYISIYLQHYKELNETAKFFLQSKQAESLSSSMMVATKDAFFETESFEALIKSVLSKDEFELAKRVYNQNHLTQNPIVNLYIKYLNRVKEEKIKKK